MFERWGLPQKLRVDNGYPWGNSGDFPPVLALWLMGLGIGMIWNRPHHPQENGCVERSHGVSKAWGEPHQCQSIPQLRQHLQQVIEIQQNRYPSVEGQPRTQAYPQLKTVVRPYHTAQEEQMWSLEPIAQFFAQGLWWRQVDKGGKIYFGGCAYGVGRRHAHEKVAVQFDPNTYEWVISHPQGQELKRHAADRIVSAQRIRALEEVTPKRESKQFPTSHP